VIEADNFGKIPREVSPVLDNKEGTGAENGGHHGPEKQVADHIGRDPPLAGPVTGKNKGRQETESNENPVPANGQRPNMKRNRIHTHPPPPCSCLILTRALITIKAR